MSNLEPLDDIDDDASEEVADWGGGELEAAYLKAMMALEASEAEFPEAPPAVASSTAESDDIDQTDRPHSPAIESPVPTHAMPELTVSLEESQAALANLFLEPPASPPPEPVPAAPVEARVTPRQIVEACLFVGGPPLTAKRLAGVLRGESDSEFVEREINDLNRLYAAEGRPYEIRLVEGGYRLALREEFERIRNKVYGLGPKEVRLSQEALEVLAVVAYHQPIKQAQVEELGKPGCGPVLRQLVRRELLAVERDPAHPRDVNYKTTARFLSLFGIRNLDELPRHEQVSYK